MRVRTGGRIFLSMVAGLALAGAAAAVEDMAAGKTPAQLFTSDCSECHRTPGGLAKGRDISTLASFLTEHYTTKSEYARSIAAYVASFAPPAPTAVPRRDVGATAPDQSHPRTAEKPPSPPLGVPAATADGVGREAPGRSSGTSANHRSGEGTVGPLQAISAYLDAMLGTGSAAGGIKAGSKMHHARAHHRRQDAVERQAESSHKPKAAAERSAAELTVPSPETAEQSPPPSGRNSDSNASRSSAPSIRRLAHRGSHER